MRADMRNKITIQHFTTSQDTYGQQIETWATFATVWASIEPLVGKEYFAAQQMQSENTVKIRLHYMSGIKPTMRVIYGSRTLTIDSVINYKEQNREILLMCKEDVV